MGFGDPTGQPLLEAFMFFAVFGVVSEISLFVSIFIEVE